MGAVSGSPGGVDLPDLRAAGPSRDIPQEPEYSELTAPALSADGRVLFVNIQSPGITLAITGPWHSYPG